MKDIPTTVGLNNLIKSTGSCPISALLFSLCSSRSVIDVLIAIIFLIIMNFSFKNDPIGHLFAHLKHDSMELKILELEV